MRARTELALGVLFSLALHAALLAGASWLLPSAPGLPPGESELDVSRECTVVALAPAAARALLEPSVAAHLPSLRAATRRHPERASLPASLPSAPEPASPPPSLDLPPRAFVAQPVAHESRPQRLHPSPLHPETPQSETPPRHSARPFADALPSAARAHASPDSATTESTSPPRLGQRSALVLARPVQRYPEAARSRDVEGTVLVGVEVARDGHVARSWCLRSSGSRLLDRSALADLLRWRFDPRAVEAAGLGWTFSQSVRYELD